MSFENFHKIFHKKGKFFNQNYGLSMNFEGGRRGITADLKRLGINTKIISFSDLTTIGVGGEPYAFAFPRNIDEVKKLFEYIIEKEIPFIPVGNGSKLIVRDGKIPRLAVSFNLFESHNEVEWKDHFKVYASAGTSLQFIVACGIKKGFEGVEKISGIPGCIGGAIKKNAGTKFGSISDFVENVEVLSLNNGSFEIKKVEPKFEYRWSSIGDNQIILSATLKFKKAKPTEVKSKVSEYLKRRYETQPLTAKTCGCIFKNPPQAPAGKIIDELGLKGFRLSKRARISPVHANFIENENSAPAAEIYELIDYVKEKAREQRKIELEEEAVLLKDI